MIFKSYHIAIGLRAGVLGAVSLVMSWAFIKAEWILFFISLSIFFITIYNFFSFFSKRFEVIDDFFESVKYRDFSRNYLAENKTKDIHRLYTGFNTVNQTVREMNSEKEVQYLYLQKILEMIDVGILAYDIGSGNTLWVNEAFQNMMDFPQFKNIKFVKSRTPDIYQKLFKNQYLQPTAVDLKIRNENLKVLTSQSVFKVDNNSCKLIVTHNIDDTVNKTESEAWKKLLSVMTHEIMNSIAPISSLANTLKSSVRKNIDDSLSELDLEDLDAGLSSIEKRSEGLMKFAKTYRSLNKVTSLNKEIIVLKELFNDIEQLMKTKTLNRNMLRFEVEDLKLEVEADSYLLEQILINLILNAVEACEAIVKPEILVKAVKKPNGKIMIAVIDNGSGIPQEIQDQIFVPFFTTKKKGSGIGLSLSRQIMTLHGGKIQIDNIQEKGAQVSLVF
ncbi:Histidine kinase-, DNA gyrase B-, and HSP90-like ATPase [Gillisia sp. Hel1_33_143]|uniref:sensor histidine kinase n=1 Tax=Gillisia sp. Hel1_33_143 TaxID=1336796 RepID=UPI0008793E9D|nr:HAMP domain-containing sensor histidine kinase [Gillisia sp. Hel1_33_143]SDS74987.1 Histidine kinase-, DNA gyrase B-, and HSP90-like ATPase [Gillisia sp. Hel1_33_143]